MSEDARTPEASGTAAAGAPTDRGDGWAEPASREHGTRADEAGRWVDGATGEGPQYAAAGADREAGEPTGPVERTRIDAPPAAGTPAEGAGPGGHGPRPAGEAGPFAAPVPGAGAGPFAAPVPGATRDGADSAPRVSLGKPGTDRQPEPNPWAPPQENGAPADARRGGAAQPPAPGMPYPGPAGPPGSGGPSWDNPFAAPAAPTPYPQPGPGEFVPPPPISPDGPGHPPYAYGYPQYPGPGPSGHGGVPGYGWPMAPPSPSNGMGTSALVLGIIASVLFCAWPLAIVLGILAVVFGVIGRRKARRGEATNPGQALAGIICGSVGIVLGAALMVVIILVPDDFGDEDSDTYDGFSTSLVTQQR
ncbi:DUF4190 domain-containing protein [Streptomyces sp. NPDC048566]|uniref:DUF4190 domain-containing protein n=1 Tax=Streptomyces sp. NPDC048566 TaxID=3365569 RepID=UPI0037176694